jgi:GT2 family glycosyltransferase
MKKVAIVILNWNGAAMMRRFLPSVIEHSADVADIIVADNDSKDAHCKGRHEAE